MLQSILKADVFYIIYTSNINGAIENCGCGSDPLGGLSRAKSVIDQFRKDNKDVFVIDGGDYFNSYPFPSLNDAMLKALVLIDYDCIVPGDQEFIEGPEFFSRYISDLKDKVILTNSSINIQQFYEKTLGINRIMIYGYMSPYIFDFVEKPEDMILSNFVSEKPRHAEKNLFQIAVIHGYLSNAEQFALENSSISLILLAHDQRKGVWDKNGVRIVGNGKDSEYISIIKVTNEGQWDISVDQMKISEEIPEDEQVLNLIQEYKSK
jgi:2',3'-cyclic-nucleotide 2'-phosphodiesterase (5'-nucleotidase family)